MRAARALLLRTTPLAAAVLPLGSHTYGMNMSASMRQFNNIMRAKWVGDPVEGQYTATRQPYVDANGEIVSFPPGITTLLKELPWPNQAGITKRFALTFDGQHGVVSSSGTVYLNLALSGGKMTNVTYAANRIEFDFTTPNPIPAGGTSQYVVVSTNGFNPANPVRNFDCREITGPGGAVVDPGTWHADFLAYSKTTRGDKIIRFMDLMLTNNNVFEGGDGTFTWAKRSQSLTSAPAGRARLTVGTGNAAIRFLSPDYIRTTFQAMAAFLPDHGFGDSGNNTTITITIGSHTGLPIVSTSGTSMRDILITMQVGGNTVNEVRTAITANETAYTRVVTDLPPSAGGSGAGGTSNGTGICPTCAKTNLADGTFGTGRDGPPLESLCELANLIGAKPWFVIPINATADYVSNFAQIVDANITNPDCFPIRFEFGNEAVWNFSFPCSGWLAAWSYHNGLSGPSIGEYAAREYATRFKNVMGAAKSVLGSKVVLVAGGQAANPIYQAIYEGVSGFNAVVEEYCIAPYFYGWTESQQASFVGEVNDPVWFASALNSINQVTSYATTAISLYGKPISFYEGGQHEVDTHLDDMQRRQRSSMMKYLYGYYLGEHKRKANVGQPGGIPFCHYSDIGGISVGASGAWGMQEYRDQPRNLAPKYDAWINAVAGIYPPYMIYPVKPQATGIRMVSEVLTVSIPAFYYAASATIQLVRNGTPVGAPAALSVPSTPQVQTWQYTQVTADANATLEFRVALTNANGDTNYIDYLTADNLQTIPFTKFVEITFPFTVPADYNPAKGGDVHLIGAGGRGLAVSTGTGRRIPGGGGGAYAFRSYTNEFAAGDVISGSIAAEGSEADTWFRTNTASDVKAKAGTNAVADDASSAGNGKGGQAASCFGTVTRSGGDAATVPSINLQPAGGASAAGPNGPGIQPMTPGNYPGPGAGANGGGVGSGGGFNGAQIGPNGGINRFGNGGGTGGQNGINSTAGVDGGGGGAGGGTTLTERQGGNNSLDPVWRMTADGTYRGPGSGPGGAFGTLLGQQPGACVAGWGGGSAGRAGSTTRMAACPGGGVFAYRV